MSPIKAYFDESGNTGCVLSSDDGILNFKEQPVFAIGSVIVKNAEDEQKLIEKYKKFKEKFDIKDEIKGSDLMTRDKNEHLKYFMENILDGSHYKINLYDKRFYLATLLLTSLLGTEFQDKNKVDYYSLASCLSIQSDEFYEKYCQYICNPNVADFHDYLNFLKNFKYIHINKQDNGLLSFVDCILSNSREEDFYKDFLTFGSYNNKKITNVINLVALGELIYHIKLDNIQNSDLILIHDNIQQFQKTISEELYDVGINISFMDSKKCVLLQIADNIASIMCHAFCKVRQHFYKKEEWQNCSEWDMKLYSKLLSIVDIRNIKFTVPICDWALSLCVKEMFSNSFPSQNRKNLFFNDLYQKSQEQIFDTLNNSQKDISFVYNMLKH